MEHARLIPALLILVLAACDNRSDTSVSASQTAEFHDYWHAGKAEISSYHLQQSRYGEPRVGKAVMIFVTEDLARRRQVKLDNPDHGDKVNVLKLNFTRKFTTGIYPYSVMLSVFTPTDLNRHPATVKTTMSVQEWCGQVYTQMNLRSNRYVVRSHSYFEQEGDERFSIRTALLEDELWNRIRLDHESLPVGKVSVIPGLVYTRLRHVDMEARPAVADKTATDSTFVYTLQFPQDERSLSIRYEKIFPYTILHWKETWLENGQLMETTATLDKMLHTDYWNKNRNEFLYLRDSLNLPYP